MDFGTYIYVHTQVSCVSAVGAADTPWPRKSRARNPIVDRWTTCMAVMAWGLSSRRRSWRFSVYLRRVWWAGLQGRKGRLASRVRSLGLLGLYYTLLGRMPSP